mgnify:CR=1 FL=1
MDFYILDFIQSYIRCDFLDVLFSHVTMLGNGGMIWIIICLCLILKKNYRKAGICILLAMLIGNLLGEQVIKPIVARPRPFMQQPFDLIIAAPSGYSFPSGHTASSFCAALFLTLVNRRFAVPAYLLAAAIAFSRLYLYVHFPTDVLAGIILGTLCALAV